MKKYITLLIAAMLSCNVAAHNESFSIGLGVTDRNSIGMFSYSWSSSDNDVYLVPDTFYSVPRRPHNHVIIVPTSRGGYHYWSRHNRLRNEGHRRRYNTHRH